MSGKNPLNSIISMGECKQCNVIRLSWFMSGSPGVISEACINRNYSGMWLMFHSQCVVCGWSV